MADIQFHSSGIAGFWAHLLNGNMNDPANLIYSFKEKGAPSNRWMTCVNSLHDDIQNGSVQTIDQLTHFVFDKQPGHTFTKEQQAESQRKSKALDKEVQSVHFLQSRRFLFLLYRA